jgi:Ala-tRNA(Pro) deacylase
VPPGSATPFALMNDTQKQVKVVIEDRFEGATHCVFHPLKNDYSTVVSVTDLLAFIRHFGYDVQLLPLA